MPQYYFDVHDDQGVHRDDVGLDLPDMQTAMAEARRALGDMTRDGLPQANGETLEILIRDHGEGPIKLTLSLTSEKVEPSAKL